MLSERERAVLAAVCDTFIPAVPVAADPHGYWARRASDLGVPEAIERFIQASQDEAGRREFRRLLRLLDNPLSVLLHGGGLGRFRYRPQARREAVLRSWSTSLLGAERQGFQVLKRLAGLFHFGLTDPRWGGGTPANPNWRPLNYPGPGPEHRAARPPRSSGIRPLEIAGDTTLEADAVVVGSGAGGGVAAARLAEAGKSVVVLEQGRYVPPQAFHGRELDALRELYWAGGTLASRDGAVAVLAGACLGGGTTVNWTSSFRPPLSLRQEWEAAGVEDLTGADFEAAIDAVEARIHVTDAESEYVNSSPDGRLAYGCHVLGYHLASMRRNVRGCGDCGWCGFGCPRSAKQSTPVTFLEDAAAAGARLVVGCRAEKVLVENGRAIGVEATVPDPKTGGRFTVTVRARAVVLAGGSIGSPVLLLRSGLENPNIGRHLRVHPTVVATGVYAEPAEPWSGVMQAVFSDEFADLDRGYGFKLETAPAHPALIAAATPWTSGAEYKASMLKARYAAHTIVLVRDRGEGRVTATPGGRPVIEYRLHPYDAKHAVRGLQEAARAHAAAGAVRLATAHVPPLAADAPGGFDQAAVRKFCAEIHRRPTGPNQLAVWTAHQMGTCRMGKDPRTSVFGPWGEAHDVRGLWVADASAFPSASGVNPMITIMALAYRNAGAVAASL